MNFAFSQREVVGEGAAETLVETTWVPVFAWLELNVGEEVETKCDFIVGLVGDELGVRYLLDVEQKVERFYLLNI